ncbi:MAG: hypothetical protein PHI31_04860 [Desulfuromonadaceae bacterium]|nr:hypothetical protein [Desulfuromonadaceae bacterium]
MDDSVRALREIIQEAALLGIWRTKSFDYADFHGGTALRILSGLDRFSENPDLSLLTPSPDVNLARYTASLEVRAKCRTLIRTPVSSMITGLCSLHLQ